MAILTRRSRWLVPAAVAVAVAGGVGGSMIAASADPKLPDRSAAQLLADLQGAHVDGLSGTVVEKADLGLPALPVASGGRGSSDMTSLISGSHTLRVWTAGDDKSRIALLGTFGESDIIRNGTDVWSWMSHGNTADHYVIPAGDPHEDGTPPSRSGATDMPATPEEAAKQVLAAIDPTTKVTTDGTAKIAGRSAYELVVAPKDSRSMIGQVRLAIDAKSHIPLRVQVMAKGKTDPALEIGFTHLSLTRPDDANFQFTPPAGAKVNQHPAATQDKQQGDKGTNRVIGSGWTRILVGDGVSLPAAGAQGGKGGNGDNADNADKGDGFGGDAGAVLDSLPKVTGAFGSGRILKSNIGTVLLTDDGRVFAGAVGPDMIIEAAGR